MKKLLLAALFAAPLAAPALAQDFGATGGRDFSVELGLGVQGKPTYPGAEDAEVSPWVIWQNARLGGAGGEKQGFSIAPSLGLVGPRDPSDDAALAGLDKIDRSYEVGAKVSYGAGPVTAYGTLRRGFGGNEGLTGEVGATYRTDLSDRVTLWSGLELGYGNDDYNGTYFGVSPSEAIYTVRENPALIAGAIVELTIHDGAAVSVSHLRTRWMKLIEVAPIVQP
ncbi:MAG TPA: hypothetical protein EYO87_17390, partial [Paracoccus sp.]|nr:hypothetical protein [Paracoccus sp. (in: a-proteobacteria)]